MPTKNKLLSIRSDSEQEALYGLPDFDDAHRMEYLARTGYDLALASSRRGLHAQIYCIIQIGEHEKPRGSHRMMPSTVVKITTIIS